MESKPAPPFTNRRIWVRILYMLLFWIAYSIAELLLVIVAIFQAGAAVFTGHINDAVHRFGNNLTIYITHIFQFATFNSEHLPFPFADWPNEEARSSPWTKTTAVDDVDAYDVESETDELTDEVAEDVTDDSDEQVPNETDSTPPKTDDSP